MEVEGFLEEEGLELGLERKAPREMVRGRGREGDED